MDEINAVARGSDRYRARRHRLKSLLFKFDNAGAAARILDIVIEQGARH
jgi:hypothetical protein